MHHQKPWRNRNRTLWFLVCCLCVFSSGTVAASEQEPADESFPWLHTLDAGEWSTTFKTNKQILQTGKRLQQIPYGLHSLEQDQSATPTVLIAIHGFKARGYEWVYPLLTMDDESIHTHYFHWDYLAINARARTIFLRDLDELIKKRTAPLERILIVAHSCGGVMVTAAIDDLPKNVTIDIHTVASPLNGLGLFTVCRSDLPDNLPDNVSLTQWRTVKEKDSVYWWFPRDPQTITRDYGRTVSLPKKYHGIRLGHVRSLSWVAERIFDKNPLSESSSSEQSGERQTLE